MVSFTLLLSAATLVLGSTSSAFKLSEASSPLENIILQDEYGLNVTYNLVEYCRPKSLSARGWSQAGPVNITLFEFPCSVAPCKEIEQVATNISQNDMVQWVNDVPVNRSFLLVYSQGEGRSSGLSVAYMTIPPKDGDACDQSQLTLPFSAESLSNKTELIGTPVYQAHSDAHALVGGSAKGAAALALVVAGVAALL